MKRGNITKPIMQETILKTKVANKVAVVEFWVRHHSKNSIDYEGVTAEKLPNDNWESIIELPVINKTIKATAKTEMDAILKSSDIAYKEIKKYLPEHPETKFVPLTHFRGYLIKEVNLKYSLRGKPTEYTYVSIERSEKERKRTNDALSKMMEQTLETLKKTLDRLERVNGSIKNVFVEILDKSFVDKFPGEGDASDKISNIIFEKYGQNVLPEYVFEYKNHVMAYGYIWESDDLYC